MLNLYYGIFSNTTFSVFHVAVCVPPYTQAALLRYNALRYNALRYNALRYNTFKILYNVLFMIYTHWTTIMFEDIIKVLAVRFLLLTGFCFNKKDPVTIYQFLFSLLFSYNNIVVC